MVRLAEIAKSEPGRRDHTNTALGAAGGVLGTAGLYGGGVPGAKADLKSFWTVKDGGVKNFVRRKDMTVGQKAKVLGRTLAAGELGNRAAAHANFDRENKEWAETIKGKKRTGIEQYADASREGMAGPEKKVIRHLKAGRKMAHGALGTGVALGGTAFVRSRKAKSAEQPVLKARDRDPYGATAAGLVGGGGATAGVGYGLGRVLENQGNKWANEAQKTFKQSTDVMPDLGGHTTKVTRKSPRVPYVRADKKYDQIERERIMDRKRNKKKIREAGYLRGKAGQEAYMASTYGQYNKYMRMAGKGGLVTAGLGGGALGARKLAESRKQVSKGVNAPSSNVRDYGYLPEWIRSGVQNEGEGIRRIRRNPISPLQAQAQRRVMAGAGATDWGVRIPTVPIPIHATTGAYRAGRAMFSNRAGYGKAGAF